jgi:arginyl-tRNA--protein-N-Asp/Glu arginylyltransferase
MMNISTLKKALFLLL